MKTTNWQAYLMIVSGILLLSLSSCTRKMYVTEVVDRIVYPVVQQEVVVLNPFCSEIADGELYCERPQGYLTNSDCEVTFVAGVPVGNCDPVISIPPRPPGIVEHPENIPITEVFNEDIGPTVVMANNVDSDNGNGLGSGEWLQSVLYELDVDEPTQSITQQAIQHIEHLEGVETTHYYSNTTITETAQSNGYSSNTTITKTTAIKGDGGLQRGIAVATVEDIYRFDGEEEEGNGKKKNEEEEEGNENDDKEGSDEADNSEKGIAVATVEDIYRIDQRQLDNAPRPRKKKKGLIKKIFSKTKKKKKKKEAEKKENASSDWSFLNEVSKGTGVTHRQYSKYEVKQVTGSGKQVTGSGKKGTGTVKQIAGIVKRITGSGKQEKPENAKRTKKNFFTKVKNYSKNYNYDKEGNSGPYVNYFSKKKSSSYPGATFSNNNYSSKSNKRSDGSTYNCSYTSPRPSNNYYRNLNSTFSSQIL